MAFNLSLISTNVNDTNAVSLIVSVTNSSLGNNPVVNLDKANFLLYIQGSNEAFPSSNYDIKGDNGNYEIKFTNNAPAATDYIIIQTTGVVGTPPISAASNKLFVDFTETFTDGSTTFNQFSFPEAGNYSIVLNTLNDTTLNKASTEFLVVNPLDVTKATISVTINPNRSVFVNETVPVVVTANDAAGNPIVGLKAPVSLYANKINNNSSKQA